MGVSGVKKFRDSKVADGKKIETTLGSILLGIDIVESLILVDIIVGASVEKNKREQTKSQLYHWFYNLEYYIKF